jgi:hypothetical protein
VSTLTKVRGVVVGVVRREEVEADPELERWINATFGVSDLEGVQGATARVVTLAEESTIVCPAHGRRLVPDACRSCRFLAGEVVPPPS